MKSLFLFLFLSPFCCFGQLGYINTIVGGGASGFSGDGGPAVTAQMGQAMGVCADGSGNIYVADIDNYRIRKITPGGIISTVAGGGSLTYDGVPATSASLYLGAITVDNSGNIYLVDGCRIRKVNSSTGIITTIAGTGYVGFGGDGGPATAAFINSPAGLCFDNSGNLYIGDEGNVRVRKVNTAGIISTIAGNGSAGFSGDGAAATAAQLQSPDGLCVDHSGNLFVADRYNFRIRKIDVSGIISTYAGSGSSGYSGDGGQATTASFYEPSSVTCDDFGNLYVADFHNSVVRMVAPTGVTSTFAGGGSSHSSGIPATSALFSDVWGIGVDNYNNIYIPDRYNYRVCKVNGVGLPYAVADSFSVFINPLCIGPSVTVIPVHYSPSLHVKTMFGEGGIQSDTFSAISGYSSFSHSYNFPGEFTIKHVLYNGTVPLDSIAYSYSYQFCRTLPVRLFNDANSNCTFDSGSDFLLNQPTTFEVDSNGAVIDTVVLMGGINYNANGNPGDIYEFRALTTVPGVNLSCSSIATITDTLVSGNNLVKYLGFHCSSIAGFDLAEYTTVQSGIHMQTGHVSINNSYCTPQSSILKVAFSPKYAFESAYPTATTVTSNTITWNLGALSSVDFESMNVHYTLSLSGTYLMPGDTVNSVIEVSPISGDAQPSNNTSVRIDTIKSSYDPNEMIVSPSGYIPAGTMLTYSIEFENTGNDTAHNIYVLDTIPSSLDIRSLAISASSNTLIISKFLNGPNWVVKFDFPGINLLDSSHHNKCTGLFVYTIKSRIGLVPGTTIHNRAGIYFDDNAVVMTNTVTDIVAGPEDQKSIWNGTAPFIYPNPTTNLLHLDNVAINSTYRMTDILGTTVLQGKLQQGNNYISLTGLTHGLYLVELTDTDGNRTIRKIVKE